jgi:hypothetical protein
MKLLVYGGGSVAVLSLNERHLIGYPDLRHRREITGGSNWPRSRTRNSRKHWQTVLHIKVERRDFDGLHSEAFKEVRTRINTTSMQATTATAS